MKGQSSKKDLFLKRMQLAEIKENAWRWRGTRASHEEQSVRLEKVNKDEEKVRDKIRRQEEIKEKEKKDIRQTFLDALKIKEERKKRQKTRLPGAVPQPLFLLLIVFGCVIFFEVVFDFQKNYDIFLFQIN